MMNLAKKSFYYFIGLTLTSINSIALVNAQGAGGAFGVGVNGNTIAGKLEQKSLPEAIQGYVGNLMVFLYLIAVMFALWGGFQILTAGGEDEKVKKGKTILIQGGLGLLVIFLAGTIVKFIIGLLA